ncbi:MAG TPA: MBL fold metallo-hydrolase [Pyrinomonadaceae bacterium]|nr:MBL fold metallo-hydrolase [Pyrinomonadaceae bacterium]
MKWTISLLFGICGGMLLPFSDDGCAPLNTLDIYFIDTEGGAATLIVTPARETLLVDSGYPEERDADRIARVVREVAGLDEIDHYVTTHWHRDHFGGIGELVRMIPVKRFYDKGLPDPLPRDIDPTLVAAYQRASKKNSIILKAGDEILLKREPMMPRLRMQVLAADGRVIGERPGAPQIRSCAKAHSPKAEDVSDNARSIGYRLTFGNFRFFAGGDLTWNVEHKLACPVNLPGRVDVYLVNHHGLDSSNNPALVQALSPRVAIINNGARKGGEPETFKTLNSVSGIDAIFQLHRNVRVGERGNTPFAFVANNNEECRAEFIKLSVVGDGKSYKVSIPGKALKYTFHSK